MARPNEYNKVTKQEQQIGNYHQLCLIARTTRRLHSEINSNNYWMSWKRTEREYQTNF